MIDLRRPRNSRSRRPGARSVAVLVTILFLTGCQYDQPRCQEGEELARNAQLAAAADAFAQGQLNGEGRCADDGLAAVADEHAEAYAYVARAKAAEEMGDVPEARVWYRAALQMDVGNSAALAGLSRVEVRPTETTTSWLVAQRLHDEGYHDDARDEIVRVLRDHPEEVVPESLVHLAPFAVGWRSTSDAVTAGPTGDGAWEDGLLLVLPAILLVGIGLYFGRRIERHAVSLGGRLDKLETTLGSLDDRVKNLVGSMTKSPKSFWRRRARESRPPTPEG
jgi:tetratricopeptide (TPR) repeat protein